MSIGCSTDEFVYNYLKSLSSHSNVINSSLDDNESQVDEENEDDQRQINSNRVTKFAQRDLLLVDHERLKRVQQSCPDSPIENSKAQFHVERQ